jgi:hypothetical protein
MASRILPVLLMALATITAACSGGSNRSDGGGTAPPPPPPPEASYAVAVTAVAVVNKDTGEQLVVGGLPAQGGELNIQ